MISTTHAIQSLFIPLSIAVIGVSRNDASVGSTIYTNLEKNNFPGQLYPVNPFITDFHGKKCYPSVLSIPETIDLAIIVVPAPLVVSVLDEVGKKQVPGVIIISSGFSETGIIGNKREADIKHTIAQYGMILLGPNCLGVIHPHDHINASFARTTPIPGSIAFLSQSGALGTALLDIITPKGIGVSHFISLGNKAGISEIDVLEYLSHDEKTAVIGMYIEELKNAPALIALGQKMITSPNPKPIIVLKGGKTKEGTEAVHSHTGSLAGQPEAYKALFRQSCIIETLSTQDFINTLICFSENPIPKQNTCAIVTNAGGPGILATDTLVENNVLVPKLSGKHNPIDLLGDAKAKDYEQTLNELEKDDSVGSILGIVTPQTVTEIEDTANAFCMHKVKSKKPLVVSWMGDGVMKPGNQILKMGNIPTSKYPEQSALMLSNIHEYMHMQRSMREPYGQQPTYTALSPLQTTTEPLSLVQSIGIPVPRYSIVKDIQKITESVTGFSTDVVIKILSKQIIHKSDAGAVKLHVPQNQIEETAKGMIHSIILKYPDTDIDGILIMDQIDTSAGVECILGLKKIPNLGTLLMFGMGGTTVELYHDVAFRFAPVSEREARSLIHELQSYPLFNGFRGKPALDESALIQAILQISHLGVTHPELLELDINPLVVLPKGIIALDARLTTES
jgi:acetyltransferase